MKKRTIRSIREVLENKVVSIIIGFSTVATANAIGLVSVPLVANVGITTVITVLTLIASYFIRRYQYNRFMKEFDKEMNDSMKSLDEILNAIDPYVSSVTITEESVDKDDKNQHIDSKNQYIGSSSRVSDEDLEIQHITPHNLEDGQTIIMQLMGVETKEPIDEDELTYMWKESGKNGLKLVKAEDTDTDTDSSDEDS